MATGIHMTLAEGFGTDDYMAVNNALDVGNNPIPGLIFHQGVEMEGRVHVYDVWESREAFDTFLEGRLGPTIAATVGEERMGEGPPEIDEYALIDYIKG